jgi:hypothetical protein
MVKQIISKYKKIDQQTDLKLIAGSIIQIDSKLAVFKIGVNKFGSFIYKV